MSSAELEGGCVTLTWKIRNFGLLLEAKEGAGLWSPVCKVEYTGGRTWKRLNTNHCNARLNFNVFDVTEQLPLDRCEMSLISSRGEVPLSADPDGHFFIERHFILEKERWVVVLGGEKKSILPNDTFTLRCRMWEKTIKSGECHITSVLHSLNYLWNIECFSSSRNYNTRIEQNNCLLYVSLRKNEKRPYTVRVEGESCVESSLSFLDCTLSIENSRRGHVINSKCDFPFVYCIFEINIFPDNNEYECDSSISFQLFFIFALHTSCQGSGSSGALSDDILVIYREALHADSTLNTEGKSFSAHRNILAARSPVFRAMFERDDMSEGRSGVVDIDDVDSKTMDRMLVFLYGDLLDDLQWEEASALYYASDKYGVLPLKQKCADILKAGLSSDNACNALILADKHSDHEMMKCTVDFIRDHEEVVSSSGWDKLESSDLLLASKTLRQLYLMKGKK